MKSFILSFFVSIMLCVTVDASVYYVAQDSTGSGDGTSWENRASLADFESGKLGQLDGDTVCFGGALSTSGLEMDLRNADQDGSAGNPIILDGSGEGDCKDASGKATVMVGDGDYGIYATNPSNLIIKGFNIRNSPGTYGQGILLRCDSSQGSSVCNSVHLIDNDVQLYGRPDGLSYGIVLQGGYKDTSFTGNNVVGLNWYCYHGLQLKNSKGGTNFDNDCSNITISGNTVRDWSHGNIVVSSLAPGVQMSDLYIFGNTESGFNRAYSRMTTLNGVDEDSIIRAYVHDNYMAGNRASNQYNGVRWLSYYRNIVYFGRNQCGPQNPGAYNPDHAGEQPYYGDDACKEECVCPDCTESDSWGAAMGYGKGIGLAFWGEHGELAVFQNTFHDHAESSIQVRNPYSATVHTNMNFYGNILSKDSQFNRGTWGDKDANGCRPYLNAAGDTNPPGSIETDVDCSFYIGNTGSLSGMVVKDNVIYMEGLSEIFCRESPSGAKYTLAQAQSQFTGPALSIADNANIDPLMANPDSTDFSLQQGSPAIDRGFWTSVTSSSGITDTITVGNALLLGAPGEIIKTESGGVGILESVTYSDTGDDIVVMETPISIVQGEGIGLYYEGASLDAGAIEYKGECCEFLPGATIEAEDGQIDGMSAADGVVYASINYQGSVSFTFDIAQAGDYVLEARVLAPTGGSNSFYVGFDASVQGDDYYAWDTDISDSYVWEMVSLRGNGNHTDPQIDPMVWQLSQGTNTLYFFGREKDTRLDKIILRKYVNTCGPADTSADGEIDIMELIAYLDQWKSNDVTIDQIIDAIVMWKDGC